MRKGFDWENSNAKARISPQGSEHVNSDFPVRSHPIKRMEEKRSAILSAIKRTEKDIKKISSKDEKTDAALMLYYAKERLNNQLVKLEEKIRNIECP